MRSKSNPKQPKLEEKKEKGRERREESALGVESRRSSILYAFQGSPEMRGPCQVRVTFGVLGPYSTLSQLSAASR